MASKAASLGGLQRYRQIQAMLKELSLSASILDRFVENEVDDAAVPLVDFAILRQMNLAIGPALKIANYVKVSQGNENLVVPEPEAPKHTPALVTPLQPVESLPTVAQEAMSARKLKNKKNKKKRGGGSLVEVPQAQPSLPAPVDPAGPSPMASLPIRCCKSIKTTVAGFFRTVWRGLVLVLTLLFWTVPKVVVTTLWKAIQWSVIQLYYLAVQVGVFLLQVWPSVLVLVALSPVGYILIHGALHDMRIYGAIDPFWMALLGGFALATIVLPVSVYFAVLSLITSPEPIAPNKSKQTKSKVE